MTVGEDQVPCLLLTPGEFITLARGLPYSIYKDSWADKFSEQARSTMNQQCLNDLYADELFQNFSYVKIFPNDGIYGVNESMHQLIRHCPGIYMTANSMRFGHVN